MKPADLQHILSAPYDRVRWLETIRDVLPGAAVYLSPQQITTPVTNADTVVQLGEIALTDGKHLALLEVEVAVEVNLARNRAGLRAAAARFIDLAQYHGVLAVFHKPGRHDWRLTLAAREATFDVAAQEFATRDTAPRRYTYLLGPNETCRTPAERLLSLRSHGTTLTLANVVEAFSVEQLNKEFFRDFCEVFNLVSTELGKRFPEWEKADATRDLAAQESQILLNRLLFLYFVQRKGWLHRNSRYLVGHFRDHHGARGDSASYYEKFLFPVFRILATEWGSREKAVSHVSQQNPNGHDLPFLNGGLFHDDDLNDDASRRRRNLAILNSTFARIFDDLLERYNFTIREDSPLDQEVAIDPEMLGKIFEELILREEAGETGKRTKRHDTGSHYTPRPIVHYICRESLAAWLQSQPPFVGRDNAPGKIRSLLALDAGEGLDDDSLSKLRSELTPDEAGQLLDTMNTLRACDPAVGSGAFPIGLLHELLNLAHLAETRARGHNPVGGDLTWSYDTKKRFIQHTLYGVDIQERATEICKLRLWLSLMVDHDLGVDPVECDRRSFQTALRRLEPLPNLDFKIRRANSLVDKIHGHIVELRTLSHEPGANKPLQQLASAKLAFFNARTQEEKRKLRSEIYEALAELGQLELRRLKIDAAGLGFGTDEVELQKLGEMQAAESELANALRMAKAARNRNETASNRERMLEKVEEFFGDSSRSTFVWQLDFAEVFHRGRRNERLSQEARKAPIPPLTVSQGGHENSGFDILLGNPPYLRIQALSRETPELVGYFRSRYRAASAGNYDLYVVFVERGLELLAPEGQLGYILPHKFFNLFYGRPLRALIAKSRYLRHVVHFGVQQIFPGATNYVCLLFLSKQGTDSVRFIRVKDLRSWLREPHGEERSIPTQSLTADEWNFADEQSDILMRRLGTQGPRLLDLPADMSRGSSTGDDEVFLIETGRDDIETELLRIPVFATDFSKYRFQPNQQWRVIFPYRRTEKGFQLLEEKELSQEFPKAYRYLKRNQSRLLHRKGARHWYGFSATRNLLLHDRAQILVPLLAESPSFAMIPPALLGKLCPMASGGFTVTVDGSAAVSPRYVLGLLNSTIIFWLLKQTSNPFQGGWITCTKQYFGELPIPVPVKTDGPERTAVESLVDILLFLHTQPTVIESTPRAPRDPLMAQYFEQWIDAMAYQLSFPEELRAARLDFFGLFSNAGLFEFADLPARQRADELRARFELLYDPSHPLRGALFALQTLDVVQKVEHEK